MKFRFKTNETPSKILHLVTVINKSNNLTARVLPRTETQKAFIVEIEEIEDTRIEK